MPDQNGWTNSDTAAAAQVVVAGINYASAADTNKKQRKWMEERYDQQRRDALTDYAMQNDYNSPAANMKRLKAAGLNPNLVYGDGANTPSVSVRSSDTGSWKPEAPKADLSPAISTLFEQYDLQQKSAQTDNLKATNELIKQQTINTMANTQATGQQTTTSQFNLEQLQKKASTDIEMQKETLRGVQLGNAQTVAATEKTKADTEFTLSQNERAALINNQTLLKGLQEIANLRATNSSIKAGTNATLQGIKNAQTQNAISELDRALKEAGLQTSDPAYMRLAKKALDLLPTPKAFKEWVDDSIKSLYNDAKKKATNYRDALLPK